jgi:hypothetical protein
MRTCSTAAFLFAMIVSMLIGRVGFAADVATTASMNDYKTTIDAGKNLHIDASAEVTAPEDKVFDALSHPELVAKFDPQVEKVELISQQENSKVVELFGPQFAISDAPKSLMIKVTTDAGNQMVRIESCAGAALQFQNQYKVSPTSDGKDTIVSLSSTSNDVSAQLGTDIPDEMRKEIGLQTFMHQLHRVVRYIDEHPSNVADK